MILIVKHIHKISVKGMDILFCVCLSVKTALLIYFQSLSTYIKLWEFIQDILELFFKVVLSELDLAHIELSNTTDLVVLVDHCRRLALCL